MDVARVAQRCAIDRALALARLAPTEVRSGEGWTAVRTGAASNDLNVVVSEPGFEPGSRLLTELEAWFDALPASWLVGQPLAALTETLTRGGWRADRTGRCCGRAGLAVSGAGSPVELVTVRDAGELEQWLDVASACEWFEGASDRAVRGRLQRAYADEPRRAAWVARSGADAVGMATGWCAGPSVEVVDVAVRQEARRRGVGRALVERVLAWGVERGADEVVAEPSPDGWRLFASLGFENVAVEPDVCFYAPG